MKLKYLGTAAYEGVPALFCECRVCKASMAAGGRNLRTRSQALLNDDLLFDFPADTVCHYQRFPFDWAKIGAVLVTHAHSDHLYPEDAGMAAPWFTKKSAPVSFYAAESGCRKLRDFTEKTEGGAAVTLIEPFRAFRVCGGRYEVLPLAANHDAASSPVFFAVSGEGKRILYAHDSGLFPEESFSALKGKAFDLVSLDCTGGILKGWRDGHMCLETDLELVERLKKAGLITERTKIVVNHFSHNGNATYDEMRAAAEPYGIIVSYDGLEVEF